MSKLIVGLGNPGTRYAKTRHNIGFMILDQMTKKQGIDFKYDKKFEAEMAETESVKLAKPQTFMNNSGEAVRKIKDFYKIDNEEIIIVHDDVDLEPGKIRVSLGGSSAGHKGVQSIIDEIGEDFWRVRVGVGRSAQIETENWVLMDFDNPDHIAKIIDEAASFVLESFYDIKSITIEVGGS